MKMNFDFLKVGDLVISKDGDCIQIQNNDELLIVNKYWEKQFFGIPISENKLIELWPDFRPEYYSHHIKKFIYIDEDDYYGKKLFSIYGVYSRKDVPPISITTMPDGSHGMVQFFLDSELFKNCYCYRDGKKVHFKHIHELQNILDTTKISRFIYGNFSFPEDVKSDF